MEIFFLMSILDSLSLNFILLPDLGFMQHISGTAKTLWFNFSVSKTMLSIRSRMRVF